MRQSAQVLGAGWATPSQPPAPWVVVPRWVPGGCWLAGLGWLARGLACLTKNLHVQKNSSFLKTVGKYPHAEPRQQKSFKDPIIGGAPKCSGCVFLGELLVSRLKCNMVCGKHSKTSVKLQNLEKTTTFLLRLWEQSLGLCHWLGRARAGDWGLAQ